MSCTVVPGGGLGRESVGQRRAGVLDEPLLDQLVHHLADALLVETRVSDGEVRADLSQVAGAVQQRQEPGDGAVLVVLDLGGHAVLHQADEQSVSRQAVRLVHALDARPEYGHPRPHKRSLGQGPDPDRPGPGPDGTWCGDGTSVATPDV